MNNEGVLPHRLGFWQAILDRRIILRGLKVAAVIGTLLTLINQADLMLAGYWPPVWKLLLTYAVPFGVSTYSAAQHKRHHLTQCAHGQADKRCLSP